MARKVFISFLGTNNYLSTRYELNGMKSDVVRFVQQALIEFLCKEWTEQDRVMIFYTEASFNKNWVDNGQTHINEDLTNESIGLQSVLRSMHFPMQVEDYEIKEGFSEADIWSVFDCVYNKLRDDDEIYLDVTHAFRSIPLFSVVLFNYARFIKKTRLVSIHYGAFEKLGSVRDVKLIPADERIAPVIDLTSIANLQDTNIAASNFVEFGKVGTIGRQWEKINSSDKMQGAIATLKKFLNKLDDYIMTCRMKEIKDGKYFREIEPTLKKALNSQHLSSPEKRLLLKIKENLSGFKGEETDDNIAAAVQWASRYGMIQQAYTLGQEFVISKICELLEDKNPYILDGKMKGKDIEKMFRQYVSSLLGISTGDIKEKKYKGELAKFKTLTDSLLEEEWIGRLHPVYSILTNNRNVLNHAKKSDKTVDKFKSEFGKSYNACMDIIDEQRQKQQTSHDDKPH